MRRESGSATVAQAGGVGPNGLRSKIIAERALNVGANYGRAQKQNF